MKYTSFLIALCLVSAAHPQMFIPTGSMNTPRQEHAAALLPDGRVLVTGGYTPSGYTNTAEIYDPTNGTWRYTLHPMNAVRTSHTATTLANGKVLIAAGGNSSASVASAEIFDPATETFTPTGSLNFARHVHRAVHLLDGRVFVVAGSSTVNFLATSTAEIYDPAPGQWTAVAPLPIGVTFHAASLLPDGRVFVCGGYNGYDASTRTAGVYVYTPAIDSWQALSPMTTARVAHSATLLPDGRVLIAGGSSSDTLSSTEVYDVAANGGLGQSTPLPAMATARQVQNAIPLATGEVLLVGGQNSSSGSLSSTEFFRFSTLSWNASPSMASTRLQSTSTLLPGGQVLVAGGLSYTPGGPQILQSSAELYSPPPVNYGPVTANVVVNPSPLAINTGATVNATVDESNTGGSTVASAEFTIAGGSPSPMTLSPASAVTTQASGTLLPFTQVNVYTVCVRGTDALGATGTDACTFLPVYDPNGGFVTGVGQIQSPAGADLLNTSSAGPATFAFVSKYLPGRNTPSGNLEFQFREGSLNFKSTSMDWLVVTGQPRAQFRGTGTINNTTICKFEADAWDGSFTGNVDAFGVKIFACSGGGDRYSLQPVPLIRGSIVIHE